MSIKAIKKDIKLDNKVNEKYISLTEKTPSRPQRALAYTALGTAAAGLTQIVAGFILQNHADGRERALNDSFRNYPYSANQLRLSTCTPDNISSGCVELNSFFNSFQTERNAGKGLIISGYAHLVSGGMFAGLSITLGILSEKKK